MQKKDFNFNLPENLIAQYPTEERSASRLLHLNKHTGEIKDHRFVDILDYLKPGDLLVMNNTRVIPARLYGKKQSGGNVEVLIERILPEFCVLAFVKASRAPKPGTVLIFSHELVAEVTGRSGTLFELKFNFPEGHNSSDPLLTLLEKLGEIPLPHYMQREVSDEDKARYQTVFAKHPGAVAAPTAGLHFDEKLLNELDLKGVNTAFVTLHVGAGTFQPIRVDNILEHKMHHERIDVPEDTCEKIRNTKENGGRVIAVGTTVVRSLESAVNNDEIEAFSGETNIFIYPGYTFKVVDALVTNFHLPESTLIMLVSAFAGKEAILNAYQHAIKQHYRFYSYGDAMLIE